MHKRKNTKLSMGFIKPRSYEKVNKQILYKNQLFGA